MPPTIKHVMVWFKAISSNKWNTERETNNVINLTNKRRLAIPLAISVVLGVLFFRASSLFGSSKGSDSFLQPVHTIFLAILVESLPFILIGAILSSLIHIYISEERLARLFPTRNIGSVLVGALIGFILPVCDCGTIPISRSLLKKGVPLPAVISFVLAAPVINPITMLATYVAFGFNWKMMLLRVLCTFSVAVLIGILASGWGEEATLPYQQLVQVRSESTASAAGKKQKKNGGHPFSSIIDHTVEELFGIYGYLIMSAGMASIYEVYHTQYVANLLPQHGVFGVLTMMALAILFSLCSTADAFVARTLAPMAFSNGPILAFMVVGQMVDVRNIFLLPKTFGKQVSIKLIGRVLCLCFLIGLFL
ncbi:permease [Pullulanibacillus sp. KACC 23026]|uniref:permease n=1 Tax=Pullulanibacillus sp. KACC 23026 TaxID=3028315 RepID=UPI0023B1AC55|nr:permease [Pullulanibacillus sp. KACC 23026]WEG14898.1 permease [Pullulanibacillus sp. KACC 23026]